MLLRVRMTDGMDLAPTYEELAPRGLSVDRTLLTTTWLMVGILVSVVLWEVLKWSVLATSRRARRTLRLRAQTQEAIQRELERFREQGAINVSEPEPAPEQQAYANPTPHILHSPLYFHPISQTA